MNVSLGSSYWTAQREEPSRHRLPAAHTCSHVIYRCHRTAGQHRGIFQESLVLVFLENMLFSEMDLMLLFMNQ